MLKKSCGAVTKVLPLFLGCDFVHDNSKLFQYIIRSALENRRTVRASLLQEVCVSRSRSVVRKKIL